MVPDDDLLAETYRAFRRSEQLREKFEEMEAEFDDEADDVAIPRSLQKRVRAVLAKHADLRWDDAVRIVLDQNDARSRASGQGKGQKEIRRLHRRRRRRRG